MAGTSWRRRPPPPHRPAGWMRSNTMDGSRSGSSSSSARSEFLKEDSTWDGRLAGRRSASEGRPESSAPLTNRAPMSGIIPSRRFDFNSRCGSEPHTHTGRILYSIHRFVAVFQLHNPQVGDVAISFLQCRRAEILL